MIRKSSIFSIVLSLLTVSLSAQVAQEPAYTPQPASLVAEYLLTPDSIWGYVIDSIEEQTHYIFVTCNDTARLPRSIFNSDVLRQDIESIDIDSFSRREIYGGSYGKTYSIQKSSSAKTNDSLDSEWIINQIGPTDIAD